MTFRTFAASAVLASAISAAAEPLDREAKEELDALRQQVQTLEIAITHLQEVVQVTSSNNERLEQRVKQLEQDAQQRPQPTFRNVSTPVAEAQPQQKRTAAGTYRVAAGDNLWRIARRHKISLKSLRKANPGLEPKRLRIGQTLTIPGQGSSAAATPVAQTQPKKQPKKAPRTQPAPLPEPRNLPRLTSTPVTKVQPAPTRERKRIITLKRDRRFSYIAELYGTDVATLNRINNLSLSGNKLIQAGSSLYILY